MTPPSRRFTDQLPAGATLVQAQASQGSCTTTTPVTCALGTVANGSSASVTITARLDSAGQADNTASVTSARPDANAADDSATATTQVSAPVASGGGGGTPGGGGPAGGGGAVTDVIAPTFSLKLTPAAFTLKKGTKVSDHFPRRRV